MFDPDFDYKLLTRGVAASPGAAKGQIVFSAADAIRRAEDGEDVILVRAFTEADDVAGFHAAHGILTAEGGKASHAALVARGMGRPCVAGASALAIDEAAGVVQVGEVELKAGDLIAIEGSSGAVTLDDVPLIDPEISEEFEAVLGWADEKRRLKVRANADTRADAAKARAVRRRGDRPLPHRAHVLRRGPHRAGPGDVHRRRAPAPRPPSRRGPRRGPG